MAYLDWNNQYQTSIRLFIGGLNTTTTYSEVYMTCNGVRSPNMAKIGVVSSTSYEWFVTGLTCGTRYTVSWTLKSAGGSTSSDSASFSTGDCPISYPVGSVPYVSATASSSESGKVSVAWGSANNADYYGVEIKRNGSVVQSDGNVYGTSYSFYGLAEYTSYTIKVYGKRSGESNGSPNENTSVTTPDLTGPVFSSYSSDGNGRIYASWSAYDGGSGMRTSSTYYTEISNAGGGNYGQGSYSTNLYRTFTTNGSGGALINGSTYYVRVTAYDREGNSTTVTTNAVYKQARPDNWTWHSNKVKGQDFNITADEWNSFCKRINQFRIYRGHGNYVFTDAIKGQPAMATQLNQARTAINTMNTSVPSTASGDATASFVNGLQTALNAIT